MQLGLYARNVIKLPHPPLPKATLRFIEVAIGEAWRIIRDQPEGDFRMETANEDRITLELRTCLVNNVLRSNTVDGFNPDVFYVTREAKFTSFDGRFLDKMPDLHIYVVRDNVSLPSDDGLFVECKPVGPNHTAGATYCNLGISRFVNGEYAWAMTDALMIGYASPGYSMPQKLLEGLIRNKEALHFIGELSQCTESSASQFVQSVYSSIHGRDIRYPHSNEKASNITLRHLWFNKN